MPNYAYTHHGMEPWWRDASIYGALSSTWVSISLLPPPLPSSPSPVPSPPTQSPMSLLLSRANNSPSTSHPRAESSAPPPACHPPHPGYQAWTTSPPPPTATRPINQSAAHEQACLIGAQPPRWTAWPVRTLAPPRLPCAPCGPRGSGGRLRRRGREAWAVPTLEGVGRVGEEEGVLLLRLTRRLLHLQYPSSAPFSPLQPPKPAPAPAPPPFPEHPPSAPLPSSRQC
jgi:hypothetical protein